jgi:TusA-related sulfurtransferase
MKLLAWILLLGITVTGFAQNAPKPKVPKYNPAAEAVYKGTVVDLRDRECPVSGGMGSHIIMKLENGSDIEVHLATTEFTKMVDMDLQKGDAIEVTGWKTELEGVQTILAREVKHGNDVWVFRTKDGTPAWIVKY